MKTYFLSIIIVGIVAFFSHSLLYIAQANTKNHPFSFEELESAKKVLLPSVQYLEASDKIKLAYREYIPNKTEAILILYHGGGAHGTAGYQHVGNGLRNHFNIAVITPDIRGHGNSAGDRGDAPSPKQVLDDIGVFIRQFRAKYPQKALFLGGHSSGAGLILNYSSFSKKEPVRGYLFISPHLGFRSKTEKGKNPHPFADVKTNLFVKNAMFGTDGNSKAVFFNYPKSVLEMDSKLITSITVNMSNALTPTSPGDQLRELNQPLAAWIGKKDKALDANKVRLFITSNNPESFVKIMDTEKHLSILLSVSNHIGPYIHSIVR